MQEICVQAMADIVAESLCSAAVKDLKYAC